MSDGKIIQENGENIMPITYETCVLDDEGNPITETIGDVSLLNTESRNLVGAINEVFGDTIKEQVVNVLIEKGIEASTNERWVSLINKLQSMSFGEGLDVIYATELPTTGKENQLCVITDTIPSGLYITPDVTKYYENDNTVRMFLADNYLSAKANINVDSNNIYYEYYFDRAVQNSTGLNVYRYNNGSWNEFLKRIIIAYDFGNSELGVSTGGQQVINGNNIIQLYQSTNYRYVSLCFQEIVDFSKFSTCEITFTGGDSTNKHNIYVMNSNVSTSGVASALSGFNYAEITNPTSVSLTSISETNPLTVTIDISSFNGSGYLGVIDYFNQLVYTTTNISKIILY